MKKKICGPFGRKLRQGKPYYIWKELFLLVLFFGIHVTSSVTCQRGLEGKKPDLLISCLIWEMVPNSARSLWLSFAESKKFIQYSERPPIVSPITNICNFTMLLYFLFQIHVGVITFYGVFLIFCLVCKEFANPICHRRTPTHLSISIHLCFFCNIKLFYFLFWREWTICDLRQKLKRQILIQEYDY